ncbi:MAG: DUF2752 domain-containing protein [Gordonia sp. (in: high G+C Gram-positive bacteria)]|uniref:DUF2752 domain-containing protein n=1 Tax=Gordonia sp. (in: high G+C Gram-positive bacteria) TaxID=84139 RepID=UPI0039E70AB2
MTTPAVPETAGLSSSHDHGNPHPRRSALIGAIGGGAVLAIAAAWPTASVTDGPGTCIFRHVTGLPCPGCGLTRSFVMLAHGDVSAAFGFNLFGPVFFAAVAATVVVALWVLATGRGQPLERWKRVAFSKATLAVLGVWLAYGAVRMISAGAHLGWFPTIA